MLAARRFQTTRSVAVHSPLVVSKTVQLTRGLRRSVLAVNSRKKKLHKIASATSAVFPPRPPNNVAEWLPTGLSDAAKKINIVFGGSGRYLGQVQNQEAQKRSTKRPDPFVKFFFAQMVRI